MLDITPMLLAIVIDILLMCSFQVKCSSTYTLRNLEDLTRVKGILSMSIVKTSPASQFCDEIERAQNCFFRLGDSLLALNQSEIA